MSLCPSSPFIKISDNYLNTCINGISKSLLRYLGKLIENIGRLNLNYLEFEQLRLQSS